MAKRPACVAMLPRLAPLAAAILMVPQAHAQWQFQPTFGVVETFTDNVDLRSDEQKHSELVTQLMPGFTLRGDSRRLKVAAAGQWRQYIYRNNDRPGKADSQRQFGGSMQGVLAEDLLYVDARASVSQQSTSAFGPRAGDNPFSTRNRTEVQTWSVSPYLVHNFGQTATALVRYTRDSVDAGEFNPFGRTTSDGLLLSLNSGPAMNRWGWGLRYSRQDEDNRVSGETSSENLGANLRFQANRKYALIASAGYDRYDYQALGGRTAGRNWSLGGSWTPSTRTSVEASLGRHYYGQTGSLAASVRSRRTAWSVNYGDSIITSRSQFMLPAAIDTAALLDRMLMASIPDPELRRQAVANYILATGLPPSLADNINYLTNRYMRQKALQASGAFNWAHSSGVVSVFRNKRTALSSQQSDSDLLGGQFASLNDNVDQDGASATYTYRLSPRSSLVASAVYTHSESLTLGVENRQRQIRLAATTRLGRHTLALLELRRRSGGTDVLNGQQYTEHAIVASLTMQL